MGIGKVNVTLCTKTMIDSFDLGYLINSGVGLESLRTNFKTILIYLQM